jgi:hypothetical protein
MMARLSWSVQQLWLLFVREVQIRVPQLLDVNGFRNFFLAHTIGPYRCLTERREAEKTRESKRKSQESCPTSVHSGSSILQ